MLYYYISDQRTVSFKMLFFSPFAIMVVSYSFVLFSELLVLSRHLDGMETNIVFAIGRVDLHTVGTHEEGSVSSRIIGVVGNILCAHERTRILATPSYA